jgi:hypothetical protein
VLQKAISRVLEGVRRARLVQPHDGTRPRRSARTDSKSAGARLIVLDAKYRIDEGLNDALSSIHAYRDALVHEADSGTIKGIVSAAYLLAPHIPQLHSNYRHTPLPGRLFHPEYRTSFRFGAVTLRPGMEAEQVTATLRAVVADASVNRA